MADMKFKFIIQSYQTEAVNSIVDVFKGQPHKEAFEYRLDAIYKDLLDDSDIGYRNSDLVLDSSKLLENIKTVQSQNSLKISDRLFVKNNNLGACHLDVEMETGTGKTYVYIKTMFELNKQYGWNKFIIVVPNIAIREGVKKSFEMTADHFMEYYGKKARFFVYDSKNLGEIVNYSKNPDLDVMIINIQAFNARGKDVRRINMELDDFGSRRPIDSISENHPIVILDEPQNMGGDATQNGLAKFKPLFCLYYSATHKEHHDVVYALDALDAYKERLVKRIEVKASDFRNLTGVNQYLYLEEIKVFPDKPPKAKIELEISHNNAIKRESHWFSFGDDFYLSSNKLEGYRGFVINEIDPVKSIVSFTNGIQLKTGEVIGDYARNSLARIQIRETVASHFEKESDNYGKKIKTLSLFFIDKVEKYRKYDDDGKELESFYGKIFEEEYSKKLGEELEKADEDYKRYLLSIEASKTHTGYFSIDKKGHIQDGDGKNDVSAYDLIMKDKERLLSFDNPVRFIFSHSALREGWDNPNVFQICLLKEGGDSTVQKRQEVGRGLRLCVNQFGERQDFGVLGDRVQDLNTLTVIASGGYQNFVKGLQEEMLENLYNRPSKADKKYFQNKVVVLPDGSRNIITEEQSSDIQQYLIDNGYIDNNGYITDKYHGDLQDGTLASLPDSCKDISDGVHKLVRAIFDKAVFDEIVRDGRATKIKENSLNDNFYKKEFQSLWNSINDKYVYKVDFDSDELIRKAINNINIGLTVNELVIDVVQGKQRASIDRTTMESGEMFVSERIEPPLKISTESISVKFDLIGRIADETTLTRRTVVRILKGIGPNKFNLFRKNPEEFIKNISLLIKEQKATMIVEHISYIPTIEKYDASVFTADKNYDYSRATEVKKGVQNYVFTDGYSKNGKSVEARFLDELEKSDVVCVYAKLPREFAIPTPVGNYTPDWAIAFNEGQVKHIFFVAETKGSLSSLELRGIEKSKISCAKSLFKSISCKEVIYDVVDSYQAMMNLVSS